MCGCNYDFNRTYTCQNLLLTERSISKSWMRIIYYIIVRSLLCNPINLLEYERERERERGYDVGGDVCRCFLLLIY